MDGAPGTRLGGDLEGLDLFALELGGLPKVVGVLHLEPDVGGLAEGLTDTNGHLGGDSGATVEHTREVDARDAKIRRECGYGGGDVLKRFLENSSGMWWVVHLHDLSPCAQ